MIPLLPVEEAGKRATEAGISPQLGVLNVFRAMLQNPGANLLRTSGGNDPQSAPAPLPGDVVEHGRGRTT
jgi:hypothetical protein